MQRMFCMFQKRSTDFFAVQCVHWLIVGPTLPSPWYRRSLLAEGSPRLWKAHSSCQHRQLWPGLSLSFWLCCARGGGGLGWGGRPSLLGEADPRAPSREALHSSSAGNSWRGTVIRHLGQYQMWYFSRRRLSWDLFNS